MNTLNRQETKDLIEKLRQIELNISREKGSFNLYGMFIRKSGVGYWDVVMAADWLKDENRWDFSKYLADVWRAKLTVKQMVNVNMIFINESDKEGLEDALEELKPVEHGEEKIRNFYILGQEIEKGIVITARPKAVPA